MSAAYLNSALIQSGGTFTANAGSNRRVVAVGFVAKDTGTPTWSATFGGVAMTLDAQSAYNGDYKCVMFSLAEASIPSGSQTLVVSAAGGTILTDFYGGIYTLGGRDQTTAVDAAFTTGGNGAGATGFTTASITNTAGSFLVAGIRLSPADAIDTRPISPNPFTHRLTNNTTQAAHIEDSDDAAAATTTYTWGFVGNDYTYAVAAYKAAAAGTPGNASGDIASVSSAAPAGSASAARAVSITLLNGLGTPLNVVARRFWTRQNLQDAATDGGAGGLSVTCNGVGVFSLTGLNVASGAGWLTYKDPSDDLNCHTVPVTYA